MWEAITLNLGAAGTNTQTLQARCSLQRDFTLLALSCIGSSNVLGGFRAQFFDTKKQRRFADRGVQQANIAGDFINPPTGPIFLREPYAFDVPDSQILFEVTNFEATPNTVQIALYGLVLRFNEVRAGKTGFPGGNKTTNFNWWLPSGTEGKQGQQ
jgi:hypothetical protein